MRIPLRALLWIPLGVQAWTTLPPYPTGTGYFLGNGSELVVHNHSQFGWNDVQGSVCKRRTPARTWETIECVESLRGNLGVRVERLPHQVGYPLERAKLFVERIGSGVRHWISVLPEDSKLLDMEEDRLLVVGGNQFLFVIRIPAHLPADSQMAREQIQVRLRPGPTSQERSDWTDVVGGRMDGAHLLVWTRTATWTSRDSGFTWTRAPLPPLRDAAMDGANLVAVTAKDGTLHTSRNGGITWDTGGTAGSGEPRGLRFLDHRLYGEFSKGGFPEIARSDDLGKLWSTVLEGAYMAQLAFSDGALWATGRGGPVKSGDRGRSWTSVDSTLPFTGWTWKIRARGAGLLAGRDLFVSGMYPWRSLWVFEGGTWRKVRDSVADFEQDAPEQGGRLHVITGSKPESLRLTSSTDLSEWRRPNTNDPWFPQMEVDRGLVVVGQKLRASRSTPTGGWQGLQGWWRTAETSPSFVVWDGRVVWRQLDARRERYEWTVATDEGQEAFFPDSLDVSEFAPLDESTAVAVVGEVLGRIHREGTLRFEPLLNQGPWILDRQGGSVVASRYQDTRFFRITSRSVQTIPVPAGVRPTWIWRLPALPFDPRAAVTDSGYLVVDSANVLHWSGLLASAGAPRRGAVGPVVAARGSMLHIELEEGARVEWELFDARGRRTVGPRILRLTPGSHRIDIRSGGKGLFARVRVGDAPAQILRLPIFP